MYKMMIVDDSNRDRRIIREMMDWSAFDIEIVAEATNGAEGLDAARRERPDIILSDISMPVMDGVALARQVQALGMGTKIIFMSFYEDFEAARSAIDMSVFGYIVKPIRKPELEKAFEKVLRLHRREELKERERLNLLRQVEKTLPLLRENFWRDLLFGVYAEEAAVLERLAFLKMTIQPGARMRVFCVQARGGALDVSVAEQYAKAQTIRQALEKREENAVVHILQTSPDEYAIIRAAWAQARDSDDVEYAVGVYPKLDDILGGDIVVGISEDTHIWTQIHALYRQARRAVRQMGRSARIPIMTFREAEARSDAHGPFWEEAMYAELSSVLTDPGAEAVEDFLARHYAALDEADGIYVQSLSFAIANALQVVALEHDSSYKALLGDNLVVWRTLSELKGAQRHRAYLNELLSLARDRFFVRGSSRNQGIVDRIRAEVHARYGESAGADEFARAVFLSSRQANNIFRQETGQSIFEYLVAYRMEKAKELLRTTDMRVTEIAGRVGYANSSHFGLLFRKQIGQSPREDRLHDGRGGIST